MTPGGDPKAPEAPKMVHNPIEQVPSTSYLAQHVRDMDSKYRMPLIQPPTVHVLIELQKKPGNRKHTDAGNKSDWRKRQR